MGGGGGANRKLDLKIQQDLAREEENIKSITEKVQRLGVPLGVGAFIHVVRLHRATNVCQGILQFCGMGVSPASFKPYWRAFGKLFGFFL